MMGLFCRKELYPYLVSLHLSGRHPYLTETHLDFETQDVTVSVTARDWKHAEQVALSLSALPKHWRRHVTAIKRGHTP